MCPLLLSLPPVPVINPFIITLDNLLKLTALNWLRVQKLGNGPLEVPGDREEAGGGSAWSTNLEKIGNLGLQKGDLPKVLSIVFYS